MSGNVYRFQHWAFEQQTGSAPRKALLMALAGMASWETGRCEAKVETLTRYTELSERSVKDHLRGLVDAGLLARRAQYRRDGGRRGSEFLLLAPGVVEWPDGERVEGAGGAPGVGHDAHGGGAGDARTPRAGDARQELPLKNDRSQNGEMTTDRVRAWQGVPREMQTDAEQLLRAKRKVDGALVTECEMKLAAVALAEFNGQMGADYGLGANLTPIVMRIRERPAWDAGKHVRLVQSAWRLKWWERGGKRQRATPQVIWGNPRVFEQVAQDAADEAAGRKVAPPPVRGDRRYFDGRPWEQLSSAERLAAQEMLSMGMEPSDPETWRGDQTSGRPSGGKGFTAATILSDEVGELVGATNGNGHA